MKFSTHQLDFNVLSSGYIDPIDQRPFSFFVCEAEEDTGDDIVIATGRFVLDESSGKLYYQQDQFNPLSNEDYMMLHSYLNENPSLNTEDHRRIDYSFNEMIEDYQEV